MAEDKPKEPSMAFYVSYYNVTKVLSEGSRRKVLTAFLDYYFEDVEPKLNEKESWVFESIRGRISKAKACSRPKETYEGTSEGTSVGTYEDKRSKTCEGRSEDTSADTSEDTCAITFGQSESESESKKESGDLLGLENKFSNPVEQDSTERIPFDEIVGYLNVKSGRHFSPGNKATRRHIKARWNEGYRLDDFKRVIDNMTRKWLHDPEMKDYLRPETLFVTKFDTYLNMTPEGEEDDHRFDAYHF